MREHQNKIKNLPDGNALSSDEVLFQLSKENSEKHNQQLHELVLKKQKLIIYLSILYTGLVLGSIFYLLFLK